ncbi:TPA: hypothetical protein QFK66_001934 [Enterococcus faecium]
MYRTWELSTNPVRKMVHDISLYLSGGFTGNFIGIAVHDLNKKRGSYADFEFFKYDGKDHL